MPRRRNPPAGKPKKLHPPRQTSRRRGRRSRRGRGGTHSLSRRRKRPGRRSAGRRGGAGGSREKEKEEEPGRVGLYPRHPLRGACPGHLGRSGLFRHNRRHGSGGARQVLPPGGRRNSAGGLDGADCRYPQGERHHRSASRFPPVLEGNQSGWHLPAGHLRPFRRHGIQRDHRRAAERQTP